MAPQEAMNAMVIAEPDEEHHPRLAGTDLGGSTVRNGRTPRTYMTLPRIGAIHSAPGKSGTLYPRSIANIGEKTTTGTDEQVEPEQLSELCDVVPVTGVTTVPGVAFVSGVALAASVRSMVVVCAGSVLLSDGGGLAARCRGMAGVLCAGSLVVVAVGVVASVHADTRYPLGGICRGCGFRSRIDAREVRRRGRWFITAAPASRPLTPG